MGFSLVGVALLLSWSSNVAFLETAALLGTAAFLETESKVSSFVSESIRRGIRILLMSFFRARTFSAFSVLWSARQGHINKLTY
jgi:hypothetical protein